MHFFKELFSLLLMSIFCMFCAFFWEVTDESSFAFLKFTCGVVLFFLLVRTFNKHVKSKDFQSTSYVKKDFCPPAHFPDKICGQFVYVILGGDFVLAKIKDFEVGFGQIWVSSTWVWDVDFGQIWDKKTLWVRSSLNFWPKMTFAFKVNEEFWASLSLNNFMSKIPRNVWANLRLNNFMP